MSSLAEINDTAKVRTAEDVERKYHLGKIMENQEYNEETIINLQTELNNFVDVTYPGDIDSLQEQIDGKVETWYYSGIPSLSNLPASEWDDYSQHIGDLYYDQSTGYVYRFTLNGSTYEWEEIHDKIATDALSIADNAKDTADSKRTTYTSQPIPPYSNGDLWVQGANGDIMVCQVSREIGNFDSQDWIPASKYTDNTMAQAIVDEMGGTETTILSGQVIREMSNYTKFTDLATGGSTTIAGENVTTGSIKSQNYVQDISGTKIDLTNGKITTPYVDLDENGLKAKTEDGNYIRINPQVGLSGYDKNDNRVYWADGDTYHMKKCEVEDQITLVKKVAI
jgi:phage-related protein